MNVGLFFDHYFNVLSGKTDTHKVFDFGYRPQNENPKITKNLYFWVYKVHMHIDLYHHDFHFLSAKTKINKSVLNLINLDAGLSMKILRAGNKSPVQKGFFTNRAGDLLP